MTTPSYLPTDLVVDRLCEQSASIRRVVLTGPGVAEVARVCLDRRLKLLLPRSADDRWSEIPRTEQWYAAWRALDAEARPALRTYTVREVHPESCELVVDVVRHGTSTPAGRWIEEVRPGDAVLAVVPQAAAPDIDRVGLAWHPGGAREVLVVGDETAAPAVANIVASLDEHTRGTVLLELPTTEDHWPLQAPPGVEVRVMARDGAPHGSLLEKELRTLAWPPPCPHAEWPCQGCGMGRASVLQADGAPIWEEPEATSTGHHYAWLAGESGAVTRMRRHLVGERGCPRERIAFMGYWKLGRPES